MPGPGFYNAALCTGVVSRYLIRTQPHTAAFNEVAVHQDSHLHPVWLDTQGRSVYKAKSVLDAVLFLIAQTLK